MKYIEYYGDDRLRHKVVYEKGSYSECIYCGAEAKTREHTPSKVFLVKPYPGDLPIVPACFKCNNSFSRDELFIAILIEKLKINYYGPRYHPSDEIVARLSANAKIVSEIDKGIRSNDLAKFDEPIKNVTIKLAIGHAVYELSEGYCIKDAISRYSFANCMSIEEKEGFEEAFILNEELWPEVGSRAYERMLFVDVSMRSDDLPNEPY